MRRGTRSPRLPGPVTPEPPRPATPTSDLSGQVCGEESGGASGGVLEVEARILPYSLVPVLSPAAGAAALTS